MTDIESDFQPSPPSCIALASRGVLRIAGDDRIGFLQGLLTNDMKLISDANSLYAALLTPQGKYLYDIIVAQAPEDDAVLLDVEAGRREDLIKRLHYYKLRAKVTIEDVSDRFEVFALIGRGAARAVGLSGAPGETVLFAGGVAMIDPRTPRLGVRLLMRRTKPWVVDAVAGDYSRYDRLRLRLGVPDGSRDMVVEKTLPLECGLDRLNGVSWTKGCYVGQEVTARTRYRGLVRRRLLPMRVLGALPASGTPAYQEDREIGEVRSGCDDLALVLIRWESEDEIVAPLIAGTATLVPLELHPE